MVKTDDAVLQSLTGFIPDLTREESAGLAPDLESCVFPAGTTICREGEQVSYTGFLISGKLSVRKSNNFSGRSILVALLEGRAVFWERCLTGPYTADVSITAMEESLTLFLSSDRAGEIIRDNPSLGVKILANCLKVSSRRLQGATSRIVDIL